MPALSKRLLKDIRTALSEGGDYSHTRRAHLVYLLDAATKPSPKKRLVRSAKIKDRNAKKSKHREETAAIRRAVFKRALDMCEAGKVGDVLPCMHGASELDHFWGRRHGQSVESTWALCKRDHHFKTANEPSAAAWLRAFIHHCQFYGYLSEASKAQARLQFVETRTGLALPSAEGR